MRTNTYEHLEGLARAKGVNCERRGKKIELTTPGGGTTAECATVAEALDTMRNDETFSKLPIKMGGTGCIREHTGPYADILNKSDRRIRAAIAVLDSSSRGQCVLRDLKVFLKGNASGLDSVGGKALLALMDEFVNGARRGFLD